jgi:hypothetical protein
MWFNLFVDIKAQQDAPTQDKDNTESLILLLFTLAIAEHCCQSTRVQYT